ncbi:MAG: VCBS repeat-containing protein, partial [Planctomycetes bacterium]|nr:VCBS repeat-containing protein [Planctomycetota bacterium]
MHQSCECMVMPGTHTRMNPLGRWILTLAMVTVISGCRRDDDQREAAHGRAPDPGRWFTDITNDVGLDFVYQAGPYRLYLPEIMGSGVALMDFDNDGDLDIYFTNGHNGLPDIYGDDGATNRYFRQEADGRFVDATVESGLGDVGYGMGVAVADIDNDGALLDFIGRVREITGKPTGIKAVIGQESWLDNLFTEIV